jgi:hypothetical protein
MTTFAWVLDSGGAGRGAWQGGVLYEFALWAHANGCYPKVALGASAGGYAAADVATLTPETFPKGWKKWGLEDIPRRSQEPPEFRSLGGWMQFRSHLYHSIRYVMSAPEVERVFDSPPQRRTRMVAFTTRARRRDGAAFSAGDSMKYFLKSSLRKMPPALKYLPLDHEEDPILFATHLEPSLESECIRPITRVNYHNVIEASCLIPFAMGEPMQPQELLPTWKGLHALDAGSCVADSEWERWIARYRFAGDEKAVFVDGGFALKMPFRVFAEDGRFNRFAESIRCDKTIVFCCDPRGILWETSLRLRALNDWEPVRRAIKEQKMFVLFPDHSLHAGFLSTDHRRAMQTFEGGREQGRRILTSEAFQEFLRAS